MKASFGRICWMPDAVQIPSPSVLLWQGQTNRQSCFAFSPVTGGNCWTPSTKTVDEHGAPQIRNISAIHYGPDAMYFFTAKGKDFCRQLLSDGRVQILGYTKYKEMIRLSARTKPAAEQEKWIDTIFEEQPYLSNVYPAVYDTLLGLVEGKDYFVLTTNVDHCFQKTGFDKKRLFYTQGDYGLFQCSEPCCQKTWDNETVIRQMMEQQRDMRIPSELIPLCPHCGKPLTMNLRSDGKFVQDEGWYAAAQRYEDFLRRHQGGQILCLELGVGYNTPGIIKYPFWQMTAENPRATYVCINYGEVVCPKEIEGRSICIDGDIGWVLRQIIS